MGGAKSMPEAESERGRGAREARSSQAVEKCGLNQRQRQDWG